MLKTVLTESEIEKKRPSANRLVGELDFMEKMTQENETIALGDETRSF